MYKGKLKRQTPFVDMAAMCSVAFVLLVFVLMTSKVRHWLPIKIEEPLQSMWSPCHIGYEYTGFILINTNHVMYSIINKEVRERTLVKMGEKYHIQFTEDEISKFGKMDIIGLPMSQLKGYINSKNQGRDFFKQTGIGTNSSNELANWIYFSRKSCREIADKDMQFSIDADKGVGYPTIENVINILGKQKIFKFDLVTTPKFTKS